MSTTARTSTARKIVGSLGVIGAAAAVAGLGTFGTFTDSTTPISTQVQSGTVSINLTTPTPIAAPASAFVPGDSMSRAVTVVNDGNSPLSSVNLNVSATVGSVLTSDTAKGLQLNLKSCTVPWTAGGTAAAPTYTCTGTVTDIATGPAVSNFPVAGAASLNPGGTDHLVYTISLPGTADNTFQDKSATLSLVFSGTQRAAAAR
ncbi:TasA family protein [Geodermatophilus sp. CPCC 206100]|uniref:TasA family protein n=1 Tax=Geodermatophilus sp. CPCC 206100 TaxID=3020054 RepID=UPI003B00EE7F